MGIWITNLFLYAGFYYQNLVGYYTQGCQMNAFVQTNATHDGNKIDL